MGDGLRAGRRAAGSTAVACANARAARRPQHAWAIASGVLVVLAATILYPRWSNWPWRSAPAADTNNIAALLDATNERPDDVRAWLELGQGYLRISQWPLARRSFQHADRLSHGTSADALNGLGETIVYENDGGRVAEASALFERALQLDPHSPQALFYTGVSLLNAGNLELARARFAQLRDLGPPPRSWPPWTSKSAPSTRK